MRKTDCHGTDGGIHGDFGADHPASGRHGNTHRGENGRCQRIPAGGPLRYLSGKISCDDYRLCGIYLPDSDCLRFVDIQSDFANATVRKLATKLAVFGLAISFVVPASVKISDLIGDTYQAQIEATIEDAKNTQSILENSGVVDDTNATETTGIGTTEASGTVTGNVQEKDNNNSGSVSNIFDWAKDAISGAKDSVANVVENVTISTEELVQKVENSLNHFIEAVAVMIITSCVIPMLVLLLFFWMVKIVLDVDLSGVKIKGMLPERKE